MSAQVYRLYSQGVFENKCCKKVTTEEKSKILQKFSTDMNERLILLQQFEEGMLSINSGFKSNYDGSLELNTKLIARHAREIITSIDDYKKMKNADESEIRKIVLGIEEKMRHLIKQLSKNFVIFHKEKQNTKEGMAWKSSLRENDIDPSPDDMKKYVDLSVKFGKEIYNPTIFTQIKAMFHNMKPVKTMAEIEKQIGNGIARIQTEMNKKMDKKKKRIELKKKIREGADDDEVRLEKARIQKRDAKRGKRRGDQNPGNRDGVLVNGVQEDSELSTQELLMQMKSMQLSM